MQASLRLVAATAAPAGAPQVLCCLRDVTAEVAAESARAERLAAAELAERHRDYLVQMTPGLVWFGPVSPDLSSYRAIYISEYLFRVTGYTPTQWLETPGFWRSIIHPADRERILQEAPAAMKEGRPIGPYRIHASDGRILWIQSQLAIERDAAGVPIRMYGLTLDMTSFQRAQEERMALQQELADQAQRLLELSTPLIPVSEDVLVMPVIGTLDPARARYALETLLNGVTALRVRYVLVDLTGVSIVDAASASALLKMISAVRFLGSRVILTGMRAEIARAIIELQSELTEVMTRPSLRDAIAEFVTSRLVPPRR
jgi:rsbT co-antagonist protein RsbR